MSVSLQTVVDSGAICDRCWDTLTWQERDRFQWLTVAFSSRECSHCGSSVEIADPYIVAEIEVVFTV